MQVFKICHTAAYNEAACKVDNPYKQFLKGSCSINEATKNIRLFFYELLIFEGKTLSTEDSTDLAKTEAGPSGSASGGQQKENSSSWAIEQKQNRQTASQHAFLSSDERP